MRGRATTHLGRHDEPGLRPALRQQPADQPLAATVAVHVGGVKERHAGVHGGVEDRHRGVLADLTPVGPELPAAQADHRHRPSRPSQHTRLHGTDATVRPRDPVRHPRDAPRSAGMAACPRCHAAHASRAPERPLRSAPAHRILLPVPAERAWAVLLDVRRHARWVPLTRIDVEGPLPVTAGRTFTAVSGPGARAGRPGLTDRMRVDLAAPPHTLTGRAGRARSHQARPGAHRLGRARRPTARPAPDRGHLDRAASAYVACLGGSPTCSAPCRRSRCSGSCCTASRARSGADPARPEPAEHAMQRFAADRPIRATIRHLTRIVATRASGPRRPSLKTQPTSSAPPAVRAHRSPHAPRPTREGIRSHGPLDAHLDAAPLPDVPAHLLRGLLRDQPVDGRLDRDRRGRSPSGSGRPCARPTCPGATPSS